MFILDDLLGSFRNLSVVVGKGKYCLVRMTCMWSLVLLAQLTKV